MFLSVTEAMVHKLFTVIALWAATHREGERETHTQSSATFMLKKKKKVKLYIKFVI